jgi:hypothetical protein
MFANIFFFVDIRLPYVICGVLALLTGVFAWQKLCRNNSAPAVGPKI